MAIQLPIHKSRPPAPAERPEGGSVGRVGDDGVGRGLFAEEAAAGRARAASPAGARSSDEDMGVLHLRVGDLARRTGKTVRALHLYEEHGLLAPAERSGGGYRLYNRSSELRVRWIDKLQQMGFSLSDIKQIVKDIDRSTNAPDAMQRVQDLFRVKLEETREQLRKLSALENELTASLAYLVTCDSCETEELLGACKGCARHDCGHTPPDLVAGFRVH